MSKFKEVVENALKERGFSLQKLTNNLEIDSPICTCFITAYLETNDEETNIANNNKLELNIVSLGYEYGYKKILGGYVYSNGTFAKEPGFLVSCKRTNVLPEDFKEEMLALGRKYNQETILLKLPGEKSAYYNTRGNKIDEKDIEFAFTKQVDPTKPKTLYPNEITAWSKGYTQLQKDANKGKNQAIELTNENSSVFESLILTDEEINELKEDAREKCFCSGSGILRMAACREHLGLEPYPCLKKR
ncbi:MAG: hypothetical protein ACI4V7_06135 [Succinivibrionaceae bacterium]